MPARRPPRGIQGSSEGLLSGIGRSFVDASRQGLQDFANAGVSVPGGPGPEAGLTPDIMKLLTLTNVNTPLGRGAGAFGAGTFTGVKGTRIGEASGSVRAANVGSGGQKSLFLKELLKTPPDLMARLSSKLLKHDLRLKVAEVPFGRADPKFIQITNTDGLVMATIQKTDFRGSPRFAFKDEFNDLAPVMTGRPVRQKSLQPLLEALEARLK